MIEPEPEVLIGPADVSPWGGVYCSKHWKNILIGFLSMSTIVFISVFIWAFLQLGLVKGLPHFELKERKDAANQFGTCEEFKGETEGYTRKFAYVPGYLHACAANEVNVWLDKKCKTLDSCEDIRNMPAYGNIAPEMRHHARLRWIMKLVNLFDAKHPGKFEWVVDGGTLLGLLRHGDIIPHDHDVDIISTNEHIQFLIGHFQNDFPKGLNLVNIGIDDGAIWKIIDMNSCMSEFEDGNLGSFVDVFDLSVIKKNGSKGYYLPHSMDWEEDIKPIQKIRARGVEWNLQRNWQKLMNQEFGKAGVKVLTYVPMKLDNGMMKLSDMYCEGWTNANYYFKAHIEDGKLIRST